MFLSRITDPLGRRLLLLLVAVVFFSGCETLEPQFRVFELRIVDRVVGRTEQVTVMEEIVIPIPRGERPKDDVLYKVLPGVYKAKYIGKGGVYLEADEPSVIQGGDLRCRGGLVISKSNEEIAVWIIPVDLTGMRIFRPEGAEMRKPSEREVLAVASVPVAELTKIEGLEVARANSIEYVEEPWVVKEGTFYK